MKLQAASKKEVSRITVGVLICDGIMAAALLLLSALGVGEFDLGKILIGAAIGSVVAVGNFIILCLTIQSALEIENKRKMKARFQMSYNIRLLVQAAWVVVAFLLREKIHFIAAAAPVFYPNIWLIFLQLTGRLNTASAQPPADQTPSDAEDTQQ